MFIILILKIEYLIQSWSFIIFSTIIISSASDRDQFFHPFSIQHLIHGSLFTFVKSISQNHSLSLSLAKNRPSLVMGYGVPIEYNIIDIHIW